MYCWAGSKQWLYGQAFAIHALAAYARVANDSEAADIAMNAFRYLDDNFHDKQYGGFDQRRDDGLYIDFYGNTKPSGELGRVEKVKWHCSQPAGQGSIPASMYM